MSKQVKNKQKSRQQITQKSDSRRGKNPKSLANLRPFKTRAENGGELDPRINAGGRPKKIGEAYARILECVYPRELIEKSETYHLAVTKYSGGATAEITYAEAIAIRGALGAVSGDVSAAREIRSATEGEKLAVRGEIELFNHDLISQLLARRPSGDHSESESD